MRFMPVTLLCRSMLRAACLCAGLGIVLIAVKLPAVGAMLVLAVAWRQGRGWKGSGTAFGTARPSSFLELARRGLLGEDGLILGRAGWVTPPSPGQALAALFSPAVSPRIACGMLLGRRWCSDQIIRAPDAIHVASFAPAGLGKSVSVLVPNLRNQRGAAVVTDPKGELFKLTAEHRRTRFKHRIIRLDPFGIIGGGGDALNPLEFIDASAPDFLDQVRDLANALVIRTGQESEPHWNDSAERVLTAFIAFVTACEPDPAKRNLQTVRALISSRDAYTQSVEVMRMTEGFGGVVQRLGHSLTWFADKELASVLSVVQRQTAWMDSPAVAASMTGRSFDPRDLRGGRMTVYLVLPPERLVTLAPMMRMWLNTILRTLTRGAADERNLVQFYIDEAAHIGKMQILEDALTLMRGYGIRIWLFFQSLGQLQKCYGESTQTILDNIATRQYFGTRTFQSADELSKAIGDATILLKSLNATTSHSRPTGGSGSGPQPGSVSTSTSITTSETGRRLLKPEEVLTLPDNLALVFHKNCHVMPLWLLKYYDAPEFRSGGDGSNRELGLTGMVSALAMLFGGGALAILALRLPDPGTQPARFVVPRARVTAPQAGFVPRGAVGGVPAYGSGLAPEPGYPLNIPAVEWPPRNMTLRPALGPFRGRGFGTRAVPGRPPPRRVLPSRGYLRPPLHPGVAQGGFGQAHANGLPGRREVGP
jgi:type IV secretion system protein VirD4